MASRIVLPAATMASFLALWQLCCKAFAIDPWILPDPWRIAVRMGEDFELLSKHVLATFRLAVLGVGLGIAFGVAVALALNELPKVRTAISPLIVMSQNIPLIVLGPMLMIWFGFGLTPKFILLVIVCFFPVAWSMLAGLGQAEPHLREYLRMIGASRLETLRRLELPASLPYFFAGLRITTTYSVSTVIVAEWLGASKGIGYYLVLKFKGYDISAVFGCVVCIATMSLLFYGAAVALEKIVIRWKPREEKWGGART